MSTYVYNSTISTNTYTTEDYGNISSSVDASIDYSAGLSLPTQTIVDYSTYNYTGPSDFSSTSPTFDTSETFDNSNYNFSSINQTFDLVQTFDASRYENFGYIYENSTITPFGSLQLQLTSGTNTETDYYEGSGTLFEIGTLDENVTFAWVGNGTVFEIGNGLERTIKPYLASGTLRIDSSAAETALESITISYNQSSIYNPIFDYGFVSLGASYGDDYGYIIESPSGPLPYDPYIDFGLITDNNLENNNYPIYPFVPGFILYGTTISHYVPHITGIGTINVLGTSLESFSTQIPEDTQLFNISGSGLEGYSAQTPEDTILYNFYGELVHPFIDYTPSITGIGTINVFGTSLESYSAQTPENTQLFSISGSSIESVSYNPPEDTILYNFYGELVHPFIDYTPHITGFGTLFSIGVLAEKFVFTYNDDSACYDSLAESIDYGLLSGQPIHPIHTIDFYDPINDFYDYGLVSENDTGNIPEDFGEISSLLVVICPFGTVNISGSGLEAYSAQTPEDTQLFSISGSSIESVSYNPPEDTQLFSISGSSIESVSYNPPEDTQLFSISGSGLESYSAQTPEDTQLFSISGSGLEAYSAQTPEDTQLFSISGSSIESVSYNPPEDTQLIQISGSGLEAYSAQTPEDTQLFSISGSGLESYSAQTPEDTQLFSISGADTEFVSYNPPENTQLIQISGFITEIISYSSDSTQLFSISGAGTEFVSYNPPENTQLFNISGSGLEAYSAQTPEDTVLYTFYGEGITKLERLFTGVGSGTGPSFVPGVGFTPDSEGNLRDARTYSNRYPINDKVPNTGIGTLTFDQINQTAKYSPLTPWTGIGTITVSGFGNESFIFPNYNSLGIIKISGISSNREIAVYGYYGNDNNPGTSGTIFISQQTSLTIEKEVESYSGTIQLNISGISIVLIRNSYFGFGILSISGSGLESYSAQTPDDTQLFSISGSGLESYSAQTPEDTVLYTFSAGITSESISKSYIGSGNISVSGQSFTSYTPNIFGTGIVRFISRTVDHDYDTCDSEEIKCDNQNSADISFVVNPLEDTQLFVISGSSVTSELATYTYSGIGTHIISGGYVDIKFTSQGGETSALFNIYGSSLNSESDAYVGLGSFLSLGASAESILSQTPSNTILYTISGLGSTKIEKEFINVGIGLFEVSGFASTKEIAVYSQSGIGTINISGELSDPNIKFIPTPKGFGTFNVVGSANESIITPNIGVGTLFTISSGKESLTYSGYIGLGTIYIISTSSVSINNPFQIPRTYTVII